MAGEFSSNGFFAATKSGTIGNIIMNQSRSLEELVGGGEMKIRIVIFIIEKLSEFNQNAAETLTVFSQTFEFGKGKFKIRIISVFFAFTSENCSKIGIDSRFIRVIHSVIIPYK